MSDPAIEPLVLNEEIKGLVDSALANGTPLLLAAVSPDARPILSYRGSVQVYSDDQFGLWVRNGQGATLEAISTNPAVALVYRSPTTPVLQFHGRARIVVDATEKARVFEQAPEREQAADPDRKGVAIIVDLDKVEGVLSVGPEGRVFVRLARHIA
jgi:hypothetical protein